MSIKSEIERIRGHIADSYAAIVEAGVELPAQRNSANLAEAIRSIPVVPPPIYGVQWSDTSSTKLIRTDDAAKFADPASAVGTGAGSSPFDSLMPWAGMVRVTQDGNQLVAIPKYWVKVQHNPFRVQISPRPVPGFQVSPAHRDRGDGKGERDIVYVGRYPCDASYMSRSGQTIYVGYALSTYRTGISALGAAYWQMDYAMQLTWWYLYLVEFANWDAQSAIGRGIADTYTYQTTTGSTDTMVYHTGRAAGTDGFTAVQYRGMENLWGNYAEWRDGIMFSDENISTYNNPANFSSDYGGAGSVVRSLKRCTGSGHIKTWGGDAADPSFIFPSETGSKGTTGIPDYYMYGAGLLALYVGGPGGFADSCGPFYLYGTLAPSRGKTNMGARLQKLP